MTVAADLYKALGQPGAQRVVTTKDLAGLSTPVGSPTPTRVTLARAVDHWVELDALVRVRRGVYLNRLSIPAPTLEEAAPYIRTGAVLSLQSVLGRTGVFNNPTPWITCVVPLGSDTNRSVGVVRTPTAHFRFSGIDLRLFPSPQDDWASDAYEAFALVPTATPEKAFLDLLYLSAQPSGKASLPPAGDIDWDELDTDRLDRLAVRMGLEEHLAQARLGRTLVRRPVLRHPR